MPKSVLVIDAIATHRIRFAAILESARYAVEAVPSIGEYHGDLSALDLILFGLPDNQFGKTVSGLAEKLGSLRTPILCLDAKRSSLRRVLALKSGARDVLPTKSPDEFLLARVRGLIREFEAERECERRRLTAISFGFSEPTASFDAPASLFCLGGLGALADQLAAVLPDRVVTISREELSEAEANSAVADAYILGIEEQDSDIELLIPELLDRMHLSPAPILTIYPKDRPEIAVRALALGASEAIESDVCVEEMELRIKGALARKHIRDALRKSDEQSYRLAATDPLTGLYNRRYAETYIADLSARPKLGTSEVCFILVDLDHFKSVNDIHGHVAGDRVLREVAHRLQANLRACDLVSRYGGEEFLIVLPETAVEEAISLAERLRAAVAANPIHLGECQQIHVTASIGVATGIIPSGFPEQRNGTFDAVERIGFGPLLPMFEAADAALYRAKESGRNRVEISVA